MRKNKAGNKNKGTDNEQVKRGKSAAKKLAAVVLNFALIYGLLRLVIELSVRYNAAWIYYAGTIIFAAAFIALFIAFFILNGFTFGRELRSRDSLPESWDDRRRDEFMEKQPARKEKARQLIYFILPFVLTMILSFIELNFIG